MSRDGNCVIWGTAATYSDPDGRDGTEVNSNRAGGKYFAFGSATKQMEGLDQEKKILLTDHLVGQRRLGVSCPEISTTTLDQLDAARKLSPASRADNLLLALNAMSARLGDVIKFYAIDNKKAPENIERLLAHTSSASNSEVITLAEYCDERGWITHKKLERSNANGNDVHELMLRPPGYSRLEEMQGTNTQSSQGFVAMWFARPMDDIFLKGIKPAIEGCGYQAMRIDKKEHIEKIDDQIIAEIRRSRFLVADFTSDADKPRGGVYYEAGFAEGLGIPVIRTCREDSLDYVHFDTRQFNHIPWKDAVDLKEKLTTRISAVIGDGPNERR
ncbi:MAG: hypothetical protein KDK75_15365 [Alphaproteobacteria bacterium]|nr:hypothetical protein [Alphaproteobacteria bacterium]